ncbi:MAG: hypothetical protein ACLU3I_18120 [Acutalibacteraceae bacterium]
MLFKNANIFVDGRFQHGAFRVEDGRFTEVLNTVPAEDGIDLENQYVIPGLVDVHNHGNSGADFSDGDYDGLCQNGALSRAKRRDQLCASVHDAALRRAGNGVPKRLYSLGENSRRVAPISWASTWRDRSSRKRKRARRTARI